MEHLSGLTRRDLFRGGGAAAVVAAAPGAATAVALGAPAAVAADTPWTVDRWLRERGSFFQIAHRGCGDVVPEHTLEAYQQALAWGATALEISVQMTSDGVLVCHHDDTLDRTTTLTGLISNHTAAEIAAGRVSIPRLGPRWQGAGAPRIPLLKDVLAAVGHKAVLCIEAKASTAYGPMIAMLTSAGLADSVIVKAHRTSAALKLAGAAGFARFGYLGSLGETSTSTIATLGAALDRTRDILVLPTGDGVTPLASSLAKAAVATGVPTAVFPVRRRWELDYFRSLGLAGVVTSSIGYTSKAVAAATSTQWEAGALRPGEVTRSPSDVYGPAWPKPGVIGLYTPGVQSFLTLGDLGSLPCTAPTRIAMEMRVDTMPSATSSNFTIAFGHTDDRYYEHRQGTQGGLHAILRMNGGLELYSHAAGSVEGTRLAGTTSPALVPFAWVPLTIEINGTKVTFTRTDTGATVSATWSRVPAGYVHIGRSDTSGRLQVRNLTVR